MANLVMDFYKGETEYSDGDIETELLDIVTHNDDFDDLLKKDKRWPIVYHLSHLRHNILNWYPFSEGAQILEVGAGCGALTGFLCEKGAHVTAVELTRRRAEINYQRHKNRENLDIYVGDIFKVDFDHKFDYVTVIGVLEYAAFMSEAKDPYSDFLNRVKSFLKPGGHILLAIENRFGLKYFAGAREDHSARFFDGVNGYADDSRVRTFTKGELEKLLDKNALGAHRFYYPLPDYKFPSCVYTDESIAGFDRWMDLGTLDNQRFELFNEINVMHDFAAEGVLDRFANSFFVDIAADNVKLDDGIVSAKLSAARKPRYRIATIIKQAGGSKSVEKVPLAKECGPHLRRMADNFKNYGSLHGIRLVPCRIEPDGRAVFDFAKGEKFSELISRTLSKQGVDALWPLFDKYRAKILGGAAPQTDFYTDEFKKTFGSERCGGEMLCAAPANIDLTFDNLIIGDDGAMTAVDYEWVTDFAVPAEYIFWRSVFFCDAFKTNDELKDKIFAHYGITKAMGEAFYSWEVAFSTNKVGSFSLEGKSNIKLDINNINTDAQQYVIMTGVAFDRGGGFDMEHAVRRSICRLDQPSIIKVAVDKGVKSVRFDPVEGFACQCRVISVKCGGGTLDVAPLNCTVSQNGSDFFLTLDPVYIISGDFGDGTSLEIQFVASKLDTSLADMAIVKSASELRAKIERLETETRELSRDYDLILNSKSWKMTAPIRKCRNAIRSIF